MLSPFRVLFGILARCLGFVFLAFVAYIYFYIEILPGLQSFAISVADAVHALIPSVVRARELQRILDALEQPSPPVVLHLDLLVPIACINASIIPVAVLPSPPTIPSADSIIVACLGAAIFMCAVASYTRIVHSITCSLTFITEGVASAFVGIAAPSATLAAQAVAHIAALIDIQSFSDLAQRVVLLPQRVVRLADPAGAAASAKATTAPSCEGVDPGAPIDADEPLYLATEPIDLATELVADRAKTIDLPTEPVVVAAMKSQGDDTPSPVVTSPNFTEENVETPVTPARVSSRVRAKTAEGRLLGVPTSPAPAGAAVRRLLPLSPSQVPNSARQSHCIDPAADGHRTPVLAPNRPSLAITGSRTYRTPLVLRANQVIYATAGFPASALSSTQRSSRPASKIQGPGGVDFPLLRAAERHHHCAAESTSASARRYHQAQSRGYLHLHAQQQERLAYSGVIQGHARGGAW
ncbi:hypothetical protein C8F04DRAFT_235332 [Mycena alexandri]|uniref:Uncharacterized protein n=1 Tax=Mycena alexandri TaxID=1745969 RepID=A0AAD6WVG4_9AGAR|nr:hypothetical protein C8F04DRAFT_235332 [Mycena alexandri]